MIEVSNVVFEYPGKRALRDVSFCIPQGSITALVGPNGAGKTTLLRCIAALDEPFSGQIAINGVSVQEHPRLIHQQVGYLSDFFGVYNPLTVRQCLTFIAGIQQIPPTEIPHKVAQAADRLEIGPYLDAKAKTLSRGLRQRLGIAQALIHEPQLLLLDEPASGLDPEARIGLSRLFMALRAQGMTLIVSSHILTELEDYCTDMLLLREGRILEHCATRGRQEAVHTDDSAASTISQVALRLVDAPPNLPEILTALPGVEQVSQEVDGWVMTLHGDDRHAYDTLKALLAQGLAVCHFSVRPRRLQDIYMNYATGRHTPERGEGAAHA